MLGELKIYSVKSAINYSKIENRQTVLYGESYSCASYFEFLKPIILSVAYWTPSRFKAPFPMTDSRFKFLL